MSGHAADLLVDQLVVGGPSVYSPTGGPLDNTFSFDTGTLDVNTLAVARQGATGTATVGLANMTGTVNLVEACLEAGFESFINTGSSSEYGFKDHAPAETELVEPNSHYAVAKAAATLYCGFIARTRNVRVQTLRLYSVYGPWEEPTRLIPTLIVRGLRGELPSLVDPTVARDFVYTEDVCSAYLAAAADSDAPAGAIFNVGTGRQSTLQSLVDIVRRLLGVAEEPTWGSMPSRSWDTSTWVADISAARQELNWTPGRSLEAGLAETVKWFRSNPSMLALYEERINATSASR